MSKQSYNKGFKKASSFLSTITKRGFEERGFAQSKLITNWRETVGDEFAKHTRPIKISFDKKRLRSTLTLEINGALAPEIRMQTDLIKERINKLYGYCAISRILLKVSSDLGYQRRFLKKIEISSVNEPKFMKNGDSTYLLKDKKELSSNIRKTKDKRLRDALTNLHQSFLKK